MHRQRRTELDAVHRALDRRLCECKLLHQAALFCRQLSGQLHVKSNEVIALAVARLQRWHATLAQAHLLPSRGTFWNLRAKKWSAAVTQR